MTRDELEAVIWRHWPTRGTHAVDAVDAILQAADRYAVTGDTPAERQAILADVRTDIGGQRWQAVKA